VSTISLPPLPTGWEQKRLRFVAAINPSKTEVSDLDPDTEVSFVPMEVVGEDTSLDASMTKPISEVVSGYTYFRDGDILVAKITPCFENGKATLAKHLVGGVGFGSTEFHVIRPGSRVDARFLFYAIRSSMFRDFGTASMYGAGGQKRVPTEFVADFPLPLPSISQQSAIADYLDREIAKIDALIVKNEDLIHQVNESRSSIIYKTITRGIDPKVEFADSGLIWLGDIPSHWSVKPLKYLVRFASGGTPNKETPAFWGGGIPWVSPKDMKRAVIDSSEDTVSEAALQSTNLSLQPTGSVLIVVRGMILARYVPVAENSVPVTINQDMKAMLVNGGNLTSFIRYYLSNIPNVLSTLIEEAGHGTKTLRTELLAAVPVPVPPPHEQADIVRFIEREERRADLLIDASRQFIARLKERRSALITAAVMGQIAVTSAAVQSSASVSANDNRQVMRVVVGAEIVARNGSAKAFGRVKLQKLLYLAEIHTGVHELAGSYLREAAGPLARDLLSNTERGMAAAGYYSTVAPQNEGDGYTYSRLGKAGAHRDQFVALLGDRANALTKLIDLLKDYDTRAVEAVATLYAVWNDALLDGEAPDEGRIVQGVLEEWHPEKKGKFTPADLKHWLAWMKRNGLVPTGSGSRTQLDRLFV